ncbi:histidine phosphatase superfamily [Xylariaceae sp. FL1651]|nr:histidine phosphatase superfamily [Xylariaceae sp. FL1651]
MAPTIHIVRHAQGFHNTVIDSELHDPELNPLGLTQCSKLASEFPYMNQVQVLLASPMQRTIQTALIGFEPIVQKTRVALVPGLQEFGTSQNDTGSSRDALETKWGTGTLIYDLLEPNWTDKSVGSPYSPLVVAARAQSVRLYIRTIAQHYRDTDASIVVVTHGNFIKYLTGDMNANWANAEYRSYQFQDLRGRDHYAGLVETAESLSRRPAPKPAPEPPILSTSNLTSPTETQQTGSNSTVPAPVPSTTNLTSWSWASLGASSMEANATGTNSSASNPVSTPNTSEVPQWHTLLGLQ